MRQSLWMIHSGLLVLCMTSMSLLFFLEKPVLRKISIVPDDVAITKADVVSSVDIQAIYENDLFGTYVVTKKETAIVEEQLAPLPAMPYDMPVSIPLEKELVFLPPLEILLKGVIYLQDNPSASLVIIQDKASKDEANYQVGDSVEDGQILKIFADKVLLIRSNGQQEMLYLKEVEAVADFAQHAKVPLDDVVVSTKQNYYVVNIDLIGQYITNIGTLIDMLDITTVFKQGKAIGCRVGKVEESSVAALLGLKAEDIISKVNGISVANYQDRIQAYNSVITKEIGQVVTVDLQRNMRMVRLSYQLVGNKKMLTVLEQESEVVAPGLGAQSDQQVVQGIENNITPVQEHAQVLNESNAQENLMQSIENLDSGNFADNIDKSSTKDASAMQSQLQKEQKAYFESRHKMAPTLQELEFQERRNMMQKGKNKIARSVKK